MNDTDLDIILAIAEGQLTGKAKSDALARIAADPELGEELAAQISAIDDLRALEHARMTASERTALRSALADQLNLQPAVLPAAAAKSHRPWWQPVLGLASAAALLLAIVAVPSMFSGGSDDSSADVVAVASESRTDTEPNTPTSTSAASNSAPEASVQEDDATAAADTDSTQIVLPEVEEHAVDEYFAIDPLVSSEADTDEADGDTEVGEEGITLAEAPKASVDMAGIEACLESLADTLPHGDHSPIAATDTDSGTVVHFGLETKDGVVQSVSINIETCTVTSPNP